MAFHLIIFLIIFILIIQGNYHNNIINASIIQSSLIAKKIQLQINSTSSFSCAFNDSNPNQFHHHISNPSLVESTCKLYGQWCYYSIQNDLFHVTSFSDLDYWFQIPNKRLNVHSIISSITTSNFMTFGLTGQAYCTLFYEFCCQSTPTNDNYKIILKEEENLKDNDVFIPTYNMFKGLNDDIQLDQNDDGINQDELPVSLKPKASSSIHKNSSFFASNRIKKLKHGGGNLSYCRSCIENKLCGKAECVWNTIQMNCTSKEELTKVDSIFIIQKKKCNQLNEWNTLFNLSVVSPSEIHSLCPISGCMNETYFKILLTDDMIQQDKNKNNIKIIAIPAFGKQHILISHNDTGIFHESKSLGPTKFHVQYPLSIVSPVHVNLNVTSSNSKRHQLYQLRLYTSKIQMSNIQPNALIEKKNSSNHKVFFTLVIIGIGIVSFVMIQIFIIMMKRSFSLKHDKGNDLLYQRYLDNGTEILSDEWIIDERHVKIGNEIGMGASAIVFKGTYSNEIVAVKRLFSSDVIHNQFKEFFEYEASILTSLHHPNVVRFFGAVAGENRLYIITEFCETSLARYVHDHQSNDSTYFYQFSLGIANGMAYLHSKNTIHRDLKPENVLIQDGVVKICDFGMSRVVQQEVSQVSGNGPIGTPAFLAPELLGDSSYYSSFKLDVYSFGMLLYYLWTQKLPYIELNLNPFILMDRVHHGLRPEIPLDMPYDVVQLMTSCWSEEPNHRPSFNHICEELEQITGPTNKKTSDIENRLSVDSII